MISDVEAKKLYDETNAKDYHIIPEARLKWEELPEIIKDAYRTHSKPKIDPIENDLYSDFDQTLALIVSSIVYNFIKETKNRDEVFLEHNNLYRIEEVTRTFPKDKWEEKSLEWCCTVLKQYASASYDQLPKLESDARRAMIYIASNFTSLYL